LLHKVKGCRLGIIGRILYPKTLESALNTAGDGVGDPSSSANTEQLKSVGGTK